MSAIQLPLTSHVDLSAPIAYGPNGNAISLAQFLSDIQQLASALPSGGHVVNFCKNRYHFMVTYAAALVCKKVTLLLSSQAPAMVDKILAFAPDAFCVHDGEYAHHAIPLLAYPETPATPSSHIAIPSINAEQLIAYVFTSGSTGTPIAHAKHWGKQVLTARAEAKILQMPPLTSLVGTVPAQHMYGYESLILLCLHGGCRIWSGHPFYSIDIVHALEKLPKPRRLISTPVHLRALLDSGLTMPELDGVVCATAPLPQTMAQSIEAQWNTPLYEIYGSTETGQIASRRSAQTENWQLFDDIQLEERDQLFWASGGSVEAPIALADVLTLLEGGQFLLQGRSADMVNIAGKRSSLGYLTSELLSIDGVIDACFFMPENSSTSMPDSLAGMRRLMAFVVAPKLSAGELTTALRLRVDAVFLPRPLLLVDRLPRNETGKLPRDALVTLWQEHLSKQQGAAEANKFSANWDVPKEHPAFSGHFPGNPILPGVVLLDQALLLLVQKKPEYAQRNWRINKVKFLHVVAPGATLCFTFAAKAPKPDEIELNISFKNPTGIVKVAQSILTFDPTHEASDIEP